MSYLKYALSLAEQGFYVFPLVKNSKLPAIKDFPNQASRNPETIEQWWIHPITEEELDYNIGISTSKFMDGDCALVVVDVDNKNDKRGDDELLVLELNGKELPDTYTQSTTTAGRHIVYWAPEAVKQGTDVLGSGLDIRSKGGYIVGAGSMIDGKEYKISLDVEVERAPEWLVLECGKAREKSEVVVDLSMINKDAAIERAKFYLENEAPESIKGAGGDQTAYQVAARVKDFGVDAQTCLDLMLDHWFEGSGWSPEKLEAKVQHAYRYGTEPVGAAAPEAQFTPEVMTPEEKAVQESYLQKLNKEYALIYMEGSHFILQETIDEKGRPKRVFLSEQTFKRMFSPYTVQKNITYAEDWLDWPHRREYKGVCFAPEREVQNGYYNLWRGFTVEPLAYEDGTADQKRGFDRFIEHVRENICNGNDFLFRWIIGYFAQMVQRPWERPLTTLVFRGGKGVGKNAMVDRIGNLLGSGHYLVAHDARYLTSNFNAHFDSCLCLVLDEAFWSGDKNAEGKLKGITTAPEIIIERKGKEPYTVDNLVRLIVIGNENWLVPASSDERRYAVYDVGDGKKQNRTYFKEMRILMDEKGGNRILLDYLKNYDLSNIDINEAPKTQALLDQKVSSLEPFEQWWHNCLISGRILSSDFGEGWETTLSAERFRGAYLRHCRDSQIRGRLADERTVARYLKKVLPSLEVDTGKQIFHIPDLHGARVDWEEFIGHEINWI